MTTRLQNCEELSKYESGREFVLTRRIIWKGHGRGNVPGGLEAVITALIFLVIRQSVFALPVLRSSPSAMAFLRQGTLNPACHDEDVGRVRIAARQDRQMPTPEGRGTTSRSKSD